MIFISDEDSKELQLKFASNDKYYGPQSLAINEIDKLEESVNTIIMEANKSSYSIHLVDLGSNNSNNFNEDMEHVYSSLESMRLTDNKKTIAESLKTKLDAVIEAAVIKFQKLDFFIFYSAFLCNGQPIVDIFYKTENNKRILRPSREFALVVGGSFMAMYYKVANIIYFRLNIFYSSIFVVNIFELYSKTQ